MLPSVHPLRPRCGRLILTGGRYRPPPLRAAAVAEFRRARLIPSFPQLHSAVLSWQRAAECRHTGGRPAATTRRQARALYDRESCMRSCIAGFCARCEASLPAQRCDECRNSQVCHLCPHTGETLVVPPVHSSAITRRNSHRGHRVSSDSSG